MKVLVADLFSQAGMEHMKSNGIEVVYNHKLNGDKLKAALVEHKPNILIVRSTKVPKPLIEAGTTLEVIIRAGAGVDNIDTKEASRKGIFVANCPGKNASAVAELAVGLMIAIDRRIAENTADLKAGKWAKGKYSTSLGLRGRTVGLIGFGHIGQSFAKVAEAMGMNVMVCTRRKTAVVDELGYAWTSDPLELASKVDIVSLHVPSNKDTKGMVNAKFLGAMKDNGVLINTARGNVVNAEDLLAHLEAKKNFWVGLDVYPGEPAAKSADFDNALAKHPRVYGTHHIGASTKQSEAAIGAEAVRVVMEYTKNKRVPSTNCVNMNSSKTYASLAVRHLDKVGVLAKVLNVCQIAGWNIQEMENLVFKGNEAALASISFMGNLGKKDEVLKMLKAIDDVLAADVIQQAKL